MFALQIRPTILWLSLKASGAELILKGKRDNVLKERVIPFSLWLLQESNSLQKETHDLTCSTKATTVTALVPANKILCAVVNYQITGLDVLHHVQPEISKQAPDSNHDVSFFSFGIFRLTEWQVVSRLCNSHCTVHGERCARIDPVLVTWLSVFECGASWSTGSQGTGGR